MKTLLNRKYRHLLWKDECGDDFVLLKWCEVYLYSENVIRLIIWSFQKASQLKKMGLLLREDVTDDGLYIYDIDRANLDLIISMWGFKKRPHINGKWIKDKERRLAHKVIPYNPDLTRKEK